MNESKIIIQSLHEVNAPALEQQYALLRHHIALQAGELAIDSAFDSQRQQYLSEQERVKRQKEFEEQVKKHEEENVHFIASTINLLPTEWYRGRPQLVFKNKPRHYLEALAVYDNTVFINEYGNSKPWYVVGTHAKKGLLVCRRDESYENGRREQYKDKLYLVKGREARKMAKRYAQIPGNLNPELLATLYNPITDKLEIKMDKGNYVRSSVFERLFSIDDATLYDFNVPTRLMHLTALFNVQSKWEEDVLKPYTKGISEEQVLELKQILDAHIIDSKSNDI